VGLLLILTQVLEEQRRLKHKLTPENAYFKAKNFDHIASAPKEELHQFLIGLYGEHILPATLHEIERLLRNDMYSMGVDAKGNQKYLITKTMMANIWARLRDRLASIESSTSMIEVTSDYAAHFFDMYVKNHDGKHMTGDRIKILLLNLPFVFFLTMLFLFGRFTSSTLLLQKQNQDLRCTKNRLSMTQARG